MELLVWKRTVYVIEGPTVTMRQEFIMLMAQMRKEDLAFLGELMSNGEMTPVIDRRYSLEEVPAAIRYSEEGHARGKIIINVE